MAKAMNGQTSRVTDSSFSRTEGKLNNLERVPLPTFSGKHEAWADFQRGFRAMLGMCELPIEMVCLRTTLPEAAVNFIMGITNPEEAWVVLDTQYGKREMTTLRIITQLLALKIPKRPRYEQLETFLLSMQMARACLKAVDAKNQMLNGLGTIRNIVGKLMEKYVKDWFAQLDANTDQDKGTIFQLWMDHEGCLAVCQKVALLSNQMI